MYASHSELSQEQNILGVYRRSRLCNSQVYRMNIHFLQRRLALNNADETVKRQFMRLPTFPVNRSEHGWNILLSLA
jgi:hypothetical protein